MMAHIMSKHKLVKRILYVAYIFYMLAHVVSFQHVCPFFALMDSKLLYLMWNQLMSLVLYIRNLIYTFVIFGIRFVLKKLTIKFTPDKAIERRNKGGNRLVEAKSATGKLGHTQISGGEKMCHQQLWCKET